MTMPAPDARLVRRAARIDIRDQHPLPAGHAEVIAQVRRQVLDLQAEEAPPRGQLPAAPAACRRRSSPAA